MGILKSVLVCGDRNWTDKDKIRKRLQDIPRHMEIIVGGARGADRIAEDVAVQLGFSVNIYYAQWDKFGRSAGPIRNREMLDQKPDLVIAFHSNISESKGTRDCVMEAQKRGIPTEIIV